MVHFHERLWPAPWLYLATFLIVPATLIVLAPISMTAGIITSAVLYLACVALLLTSGAVIEVSDSTLHAGRAHIAREFIGDVEAFDQHAATAQRGPLLDARAWLLIRGWVKPVVKVMITDPSDPVPYWLISTRKPNDLVAALRDSGTRAP